MRRLLLMVVVMFGALVVWGCGTVADPTATVTPPTATPIPTATPVPTPLVLPNDWVGYEDIGGGFALRRPAYWYLIDQGIGDVTFDFGLGGNVMIEVSEENGVAIGTAESRKALMLSVVEKQSATYGVRVGINKTIDDGIPCDLAGLELTGSLSHQNVVYFRCSHGVGAPMVLAVAMRKDGSVSDVMIDEIALVLASVQPR